MPIKKDPSGRRYVQAEVEVPGTPEEVWRAIASGPGISSWFVPTRFESDEHGKPARMVADFFGMESVAKITAWNPPHAFAAESAWLGPDGPPVATEWTVEARAGGKCLVRVVHSLFASTEDWDNQLEGTESGWPGIFRILRLTLTHHRNQTCTPVHADAMSKLPAATVWPRLCGALGLLDARPGDERRAPAGAPALAGRVESLGGLDHAEQMLLRTTEPAPGIAQVYAVQCGGPTLIAVHLFLYGDGAPSVAAEQGPRLRDWLSKLFPAEAG